MNAAELLPALAGFIASAFAVVRITLGQQKALTDRFLSFLEASLRRQEAAVDEFRGTLQTLDDSVRENTALVRRLSERLS